MIASRFKRNLSLLLLILSHAPLPYQAGLLFCTSKKEFRNLKIGDSAIDIGETLILISGQR
jgi:hypothetical protein